MKDNKRGLLSVLDSANYEFLQQNMKVYEYQKGQVIFSPCDTCQHLSIILKGQVRLSKYTLQGKEQIISFLGPDEIFGEALIFNEAQYPVFVIAEMNSSIGMIDKNTILEITLRNKDFTRVFFEELSKKIILLNNKVELLSYSNIKQRIAFYLLKIAKENGSNLIELPFSKQKIANLLSTSREVISRNFSELEDEGYIRMEGKKVRINIEEISSLLE
jgi:CRP/FNR family transcriptional regulator